MEINNGDDTEIKEDNKFSEYEGAGKKNFNYEIKLIIFYFLLKIELLEKYGSITFKNGIILWTRKSIKEFRILEHEYFF